MRKYFQMEEYGCMFSGTVEADSYGGKISPRDNSEPTATVGRIDLTS